MATGLIGALRVTLGIDASEFQAGTKKATAEMRGFQREFSRMGKQWQNLGRSMTQWVTLPILAAGAGVLKMAGDFEQGMIRTQIATQASAKEMATMREMAKQLGADTIFSASEAASGMEMLAKAGISTKDIMGGAAKAVVDLAAAAGSELDPAASAISDSLTQFHLTTKDLPEVVDRITGAVNESKLSFEDFTLAAGMAGGVAGSAGVDFKDFTAAIAGTSGMFASGSDAGTSFKTFLQRLVPDTKKAAEAMKSVGFNAFNADGSMKSLRDIAEQLQTQFGGMSEEERAGLFKSMFGQDAIRTAIGLMKMGGEGFDAMVAKIEATDASSQAAERMKGFNAELEQFKGALENLAIAIGESGFLEGMTSLLNSISELINALSKTNPEMLKWGTVAAGVAAALGPLVLAVGGLFKGVGMALPLLAKLAPLFQVLASGIGYLIPVVGSLIRVLIGGLLANPVLTGAALLITGVYLAWKNWDKIAPIVQNMVTAVANVLRSGLNTALEWVKRKVAEVTDAFKWMYDKVVGHSYVPDMVTEIGEHIAKLEGNMLNPIKDKTSKATEAFRTMQQNVTAILNRLYPEQAAHNVFLKEMAELEAGMKKLGFTAEQTESALARLRYEYAKANPEKPLMMVDINSDGTPDDEQTDWSEYADQSMKGIRDIEDLNEEALKAMGDITKDKTAEMAKAWAEMARDAVGSLKNMVAAFKSGDILGGIQQVLDLVVQVVGLIGGHRGGATAVFNRGPSAPPTTTGASAPGFATGGTFTVGGSGGVDSQLIRLRATPGEMISVKRGDQMNPRGQNLHFDLRGAVMTTDLLRQMNEMADNAAMRGAVGGAALSARNGRRTRRSALA